MRCQKPDRWFHCLLISLLPVVVQADELPSHIPSERYKPAISIIIDDMGYQLKLGQRAADLPGAIAFSFLPHSPYVKLLSQRVHDQNKEVMLHLPMEAEGGKALGPGGITECMEQKKFVEVLNGSINSIPYVSGFNNHMGSLLTQSPLWMKRVMQHVASQNNLFFVDSKTTSHSIALNVALSAGLQSIQRDVFIDHDASEDLIYLQLDRLIKKARRNGTALAIAHPRKATLAVLEKWLPELQSKGIVLVPVAQLINLQQQQRLTLVQKEISNK